MSERNSVVESDGREFYIMHRKVYEEILSYAKELTPFSLRQVVHRDYGMMFNSHRLYNRETNQNDEFIELVKIIQNHKANLELASKIAKLDLSSIKKVSLDEYTNNYDSEEWVVLADGHEHNGSELIYDIRVWKNFAVDVCKIYKHKFVDNEIQSLVNYFEVSLTILGISEPVYEMDFAEGDRYLPIVHQAICEYIAAYIFERGGIVMFHD